MPSRPPLQPTDTAPVNTPNTMETPKTHPECRLCRDGTYATLTLQSFVGDDNPWEPYCDPCGGAMASVIKDSSQKRDAVIRRLPTPPVGKAAPKVPKTPKVKVEPTPKPAKGSKGSKAAPAVPDAPAPPPVGAPKPPVEVRPRMTLAEAMRPTAPKPAPVPPAPPPAPAPPPVSAKSAKNALRDAARDVEGYDLLTMLGMKR